MNYESIPCGHCDYAMGLIKKRGFVNLPELLQKLAKKVSETTDLSDDQRQSLNETLMYLIQNIGYGSIPPRSIVLKIVKAMKQDATNADELLKLCGEAEEQFTQEYIV